VAAVLVACNQDHIFFSIAQEVDLVDPKINGTPTTPVELDGTVYVASKLGGTVHTYADGAWGGMAKQPGGHILALAVTEGYLFALTTFNGDPAGSVTLRSIGLTEIQNNGDWKTVGAPRRSQSLYAAGTRVFVGVMTDTGTFKDDDGTEAVVEVSSTRVSGFEIWGGTEDATDLACLKEKTTFLTGAAFDGTTYYLAVNRPYAHGGGIYTFDGSTVSNAAVSGSKGLDMAGILALGDNSVVGAARNGALLYGNSGGFTPLLTGVTFTGAMGLWKNESGEVRLLLLGAQGGSTSTTHGYREMALGSDGAFDAASRLSSPGSGENSTITNADKYESSLRRHPVVGIIQAPDRTLFAATVKNGLWAYRNDEWNAEE
jgi:hypothetical protein